jgi:hypothetical protein
LSDRRPSVFAQAPTRLSLITFRTPLTSPDQSHRRVSVVALAGRRIDKTGNEPRHFPLEHVPQVRVRLHGFFREYMPTWLVSSAACGSDLLAQDVAGELGIRRRVVLPFGRDEFRARSVTDRPGDWGPRFDDLIEKLTANGTVLDLELDPGTDMTYLQTNEAILDQALELAKGERSRVMAVIVWEGNPRGSDDITQSFATSARVRGIAVHPVLTI